MVNSNEVRNKFLGYFQDNGHSINKSSPLVPLNDPSLLFTMLEWFNLKLFYRY
ncbi:MAG: hypothetical protein CM15mP73_4220 [Hyphomicrobiales bacterium]|nr:MAG: hypothetical protein CM15mP73_4220 [Hyphomicrobiales bacterium]